MEQPKAVHSTFVVERSFSKPPETVFRAFADPNKARRWYAEGEGHQLQEFTSDFRVGGAQTLRYVLGPQHPGGRDDRSTTRSSRRSSPTAAS